MSPQAPLRTRIKICGLTREEDVDAAVSAGVDAVGFVLYKPSPRFVNPERAAELARRLPPFVTPVLLFVNESAIKIRSVCALVPGALLQFHGDETLADCLAAGRPFIRAARLPLAISEASPPPPFDLVKFAHTFSPAQAILLDAQVDGYGGGGKTFNWSQVPPNVNAHLVLSGGLTPANVADGMFQLRSRGKSLAVDVSSGVEETAPTGLALKGIKSSDKINQFVAAVRAGDALFARTHANLPATGR